MSESDGEVDGGGQGDARQQAPGSDLELTRALANLLAAAIREESTTSPRIFELAEETRQFTARVMSGTSLEKRGRIAVPDAAESH